ncbi:MAG: peptide chain release factor family protein [Planctomycetota bacterium]
MIADYARSDDDLLRGCDCRQCSAGGPGGQHANRTATAIQLVHQDTGVEVRCADHRSAAANRRSAVRALRLRLACQQRGVADPAWLDGLRQGSRLPVTPKAGSYHLAVAVALDALDQQQGNLAPAAAALAISTSQLVKLLTADKEVHQAADRLRASHDQPPLKRR